VWPAASRYGTSDMAWDIAVVKCLALKQMFHISLQVTQSEGFDH
jgi:hypothetical protein